MANAGAPVYATDYQRWKCKVVQNTAQALAAATFTALTFDGADEVDDLGIHDPATNNSRLNIGLALGWWHVFGHFAGPNVSGSGARARILINGGSKNAYSAAAAVTATIGGFRTLEVQALIPATLATDYVELHGFVDTAGSTVVSGDLRSTLHALYLGA